MIEAVVDQLRTFSFEFLVDTCIITRADSTPTFDENTGEYTADPATTIYDGACYVPPISEALSARLPTFGETERVVLPYRILLDYSATGIEEGDTLTLTVCTHDPELVGRPLRIKTIAKDSVNITQTLEAEDAP